MYYKAQFSDLLDSIIVNRLRNGYETVGQRSTEDEDNDLEEEITHLPHEVSNSIFKVE